MCVHAGSTVTVYLDNESSRRTVYDGVVHDPLSLAVQSISVGGSVSPVAVGRSQTIQST